MASATACASTATPTLVFGATSTGMWLRGRLDLRARCGIDAGGADEKRHVRCGACARMFRDVVRHAEIERHGRRLEHGSNIGRDSDAGGIALDRRIPAQMSCSTALQGRP